MCHNLVNIYHTQSDKMDILTPIVFQQPETIGLFIFMNKYNSLPEQEARKMYQKF